MCPSSARGTRTLRAGLLRAHDTILGDAASWPSSCFIA